MGRLAPAIVVVAAVAVVAYLVLRQDLPVSKPVTVRGGSEAAPLAAAIAAFDPDEIVAVLPREAIPAIDDPKHLPAAQAGLRDDELVIGVAIGGEARAYPVRVLSAHEIVNDELAGKPYAVTW